MGFVKKAVSGIFGGAKPAAQQVVYKQPAPTAGVDTAQSEEDKKRKTLIALNAGGTPSNQLGVTAPASVTRRALLGL